jgi:NADH-quinone oxidoreductase subunit C
MKTNEVISQFDKSLICNVSEFLNEFTIVVKMEHLKATLKSFQGLSYRVLMDLTATDYLQPEKRTKLIYWLHNPDNLERVRIITYILRDQPALSVIDLFPGARWYERELFDMFGVKFEGHKDLKRILMPDDWKGNPMLRDYALTEEPVEFKHGVKPKVPSEIIPNVKLRVIHDKN